MKSSELDADAERKKIQDIRIKAPTDSNIAQQIKPSDETSDKMGQPETSGKYKIKPE